MPIPDRTGQANSFRVPNGKAQGTRKKQSFRHTETEKREREKETHRQKRERNRETDHTTTKTENINTLRTLRRTETEKRTTQTEKIKTLPRSPRANYSSNPSQRATPPYSSRDFHLREKNKIRRFLRSASSSSQLAECHSGSVSQPSDGNQRCPTKAWHLL